MKKLALLEVEEYQEDYILICGSLVEAAYNENYVRGIYYQINQLFFLCGKENRIKSGYPVFYDDKAHQNKKGLSRNALQLAF